MDELGKCKKVQCKDDIRWDITYLGGNAVSPGEPAGENTKLERYTVRCTSDSGEVIDITAPKRLDMMKDQELCDLIESKQSEY